jgi:hypothetical protein
MKVSKEYLRKLIKEELDDLHNEARREVGYDLAYAKKSNKLQPNAEQDFKFGMANLFQKLTRPIYSDGQAVIPDDASISSSVEQFAKQHAKFTEQFMKAAEGAVENIRSTVQKQFAGPKPSFKEMPDVVEAFEQAADKFLKKISQVSGKAETGALPPSMNESSKIKISFRKT